MPTYPTRSARITRLVLALGVGLYARQAHAGAGLAVVGVGSSDIADVTWPLAQGVYGSAAVAPLRVTEAEARALAGERIGTALTGNQGASAPATTQETPRAVELAETRAALRGTSDAASLRLLASLCRSLDVAGLVVVTRTDESEPRAEARVFVAAREQFDAARYAAARRAALDGGASTWDWPGVVASLEQAYGARQPAVRGASVTPSTTATMPRASKETNEKPMVSFFKSPWFWGAIGGALLLGGAAFLLTRPDQDPLVRTTVEVPR